MHILFIISFMNVMIISNDYKTETLTFFLLYKEKLKYIFPSFFLLSFIRIFHLDFPSAQQIIPLMLIDCSTHI